MNEFVEQFLLEARELVEQASGDFLALEETPADKERLDGVFRAFHTLKGAAGIVDFAAMAKALHAAEDALSQARSGAAQVTARLIDDGLTCLDQVARWLDEMEATGEPPAGAEAAADLIVARFENVGETAPVAADRAQTPQWVADLTAGRSSLMAATAVRYRPETDVFFRGEDPLAILTALPGLLALDLAPRDAWPALNAFDPFACNLVLTALTAADPDAVAHYLRDQRAQVDIQPVCAPILAPASLSRSARDLLQAQRLLLAQTAEEGLAGRLASVVRVAANVLLYAARPDQAEQITHAFAHDPTTEDRPRLDAMIEALLDDAPAPPGAAPVASDTPQTGAAPVSQDQAARVLRVDVERIDALVTLTGELTVAKNALGHSARLAADGADSGLLAGALKEQHALLERLVDELQQSVLAIRVLPLRHVFQRFPRLVRDMAAGVDKSVRLVTEGDATEADKAVVEGLFEPLLHMLRNAVDHGAESERERLANGKPPVATIHLRGARIADQVIVEVEDDGRGVDVAKVRRVAAERGVVSREALAAMDDNEVADLIFAPGFSTAAEVTDLSGRGVGMDAVRATIARLGGRVSLHNRPGRGATVRLSLPFTLMMTRLMTVEAGGQVFGIPIDAVVETVKVARDRIAPVGAAHAFVLRNRTIPLIDLAEALGEARCEQRSADANVVVVAVGAQVGSLEVDRLGERIDVMLKPMDGLLAGTPGIAGTTLLGDGRVLIVLELQALLS